MKGRKKKCKNQSQLPPKGGKESNPPNKLPNTITNGEITAYFPKDDNVDEHILDNVSTPEVHVPSPDDAALPCNTVGEKKLTKDEGKMKPSKKLNCEERIKPNESEESTKSQKTVPPLRIIISTKKKSSSKKGNQEIKYKTITDYFPVRRSDRKPQCTIKKEKEKEIEEAIVSGKEEGFEVVEFIGKGRGVVANKTIKRGEFALEYHGDLIDTEEAKQREKLYSEEENIGCYMYYFKYKNKQYCVDATKESGRLGRLVNHSQKGNLITKTFTVDEKPHLILVACKDIQPGEELLYDYGDRRKESLEFHPWLLQ